MKKRSKIKKLAAMGKLITVGFMHYYTCNNDILKECILNEEQADGIDQIKTEMRMFQKQREVALNDLENEKEDDVKSSLSIFERDVEHLTKFLELCREGHNEIERVLLEPLTEYVETLKETIEVVKAYFE